MKFSEVASYFAKIEATTLRNEKTMILAELFKALTSEEVGKVSYLSVGRLGPLYDPVEFGLAGKMVLRAVAWGVGRTPIEIEVLYKKTGDLGTVIAELKANQTAVDGNLLVGRVYEELLMIARDTGKGSQDRKIERLGKLLKTMDAGSAKYTVRLIMGKLRLGFSDLTILDALSWAQTGSKIDREVLEHAFNVWSDMGAVAQVYSRDGVSGLISLDVVPGRPVKPMRAERLGTIAEIVAKLETFAVEPKYDGMRIQVHAWQTRTADSSTAASEQVSFFGAEEQERVQVKIFSRGLEDITQMFPDVVEAAVTLQNRVGDFVIDGEALGIDPSTHEFLSFQETIKRKRKYGIGELVNAMPLSAQIFDVLYARGSGMLTKTYRERRNVLEAMKLSGIFTLAQSRIVTTEAEAQRLFNLYMEQKLEGMLVKRLDSHYLAGARNFNWVKYKRAHEEGLVDTLDCVVLGYYVGRGKRQQFGMGAFLVGVLGEQDQLVTVAKIGTGLTDDQFRELYTKLSQSGTQLSERDPRYVVPKPLEPDVWVAPNVLVEIQADEVTKSPLHSAGYALRFPRLVRFRDDKQLADITTASEVASMCHVNSL